MDFTKIRIKLFENIALTMRKEIFSSFKKKTQVKRARTHAKSKGKCDGKLLMGRCMCMIK